MREWDTVKPVNVLSNRKMTDCPGIYISKSGYTITLGSFSDIDLTLIGLSFLRVPVDVWFASNCSPNTYLSAGVEET